MRTGIFSDIYDCFSRLINEPVAEEDVRNPPKTPVSGQRDLSAVSVAAFSSSRSSKSSLNPPWGGGWVVLQGDGRRSSYFTILPESSKMSLKKIILKE